MNMHTVQDVETRAELEELMQNPEALAEVRELMDNPDPRAGGGHHRG